MEAKTFKEIWQELSPNQQYELRDLILKKTGASTNTFWFWKTGNSVPASPMVRRAVAREVSSYLSISTTETALFPRRS